VAGGDHLLKEAQALCHAVHSLRASFHRITLQAILNYHKLAINIVYKTFNKS
jgi:hypothetical protein